MGVSHVDQERVSLLNRCGGRQSRGASPIEASAEFGAAGGIKHVKPCAGLHMVFVVVGLVTAMTSASYAHPSDVSRLRINLNHQKIEFRFTINVLNLSRIVAIDSDHDQRITSQELARAAPAIASFLSKKVLVSINDTETDLGGFLGHDCVWPNATTEPVADRDASQRFVDFNFVKPWPQGVRELWLGCQVFQQVGDQHTVQAVYHQDGQPDQPVEFSQQEPDYLYDTGWTGDESPREPQKNPMIEGQKMGLMAVALVGMVLVGWTLRKVRRAPSNRV